MKRKRKTLSVGQDGHQPSESCQDAPQSSGTRAKARSGRKANAKDAVPGNSMACARTRSGRIIVGAANAKEDVDPKNNMGDDQSQAKTGQKRGKGSVQSPTRKSPRLAKGDTENVSKQVPDGRLQAKTGKKHGKAKIAIYQCSPINFRNDVLRHIKKAPNLVERIRRVQYHTLFGIQPVKLKKRVIEYLIYCFDDESDMLVINGQPIDIRPLIQKVLGLPNSGLEVIVDKKYKKKSELRDLLTVRVGDDTKSAHVTQRLSLMADEEVDEKTYCILFILIACAYYLAPRANRILEREFLSIFKNVSVDHIKNMRWCDFFADFLINGIKKYKRNKSPNRKCYGCVHILAVIFFDFVTPDAQITKGFPRINYITQADLDTLVSKDLAELSKNVKPLDQTVYKEDYRVEEMDKNEVGRPKLTDHSNDTVADASMNNQPPSPHLLQGQLLWSRVCDLELKVSDVPEEEVNMIKYLKDNAPNESYTSVLARLEDHLNADRASTTNEIKQQKSMLARFLASS